MQLRPAPFVNDPDTSKPSSNGWRYTTPTRAVLVEAVSYPAIQGHTAAWQELMLRLLEPNVFLEPAFALSAVQHFVMSERPMFLMVWDEEDGERTRLTGICPLHLPHRWFGGTTARAWRHEQAALGTPLLDRATAGETLDLMFDWITRERPDITGIMFPRLRLDGPTLALMRARSRVTNRGFRLFDRHERAILPGSLDPETAISDALSAKKMKELRRQRRRLGDLGVIGYRSARNAVELREAAERFLALEVGGWKGKRGTALLQDAALVAFTRSMTRLLGREGKCRIDELTLDGKPVAMGIVLESAGHAYLWKIAFDEKFASFSPGVQFAIDMTRTQLARRGVAFTDSCAIADHPMIDKLWRDRLGVTDAMVAVAPEKRHAFGIAVFSESARRQLREMAKRAVYRVLRRKRS